MKIEEIVTSLRACASIGWSDCSYCQREALLAEEVVCADALKLSAADALETLLDRCARYAEENAVLQERQRWIPVTERLPEDAMNGETKTLTNYLVYSPDWLVDIGEYLAEAGTWLCCGLPVTVTHWMPLPEAPEVE